MPYSQTLFIDVAVKSLGTAEVY